MQTLERKFKAAKIALMRSKEFAELSGVMMMGRAFGLPTAAIPASLFKKAEDALKKRAGMVNPVHKLNKALYGRHRSGYDLGQKIDPKGYQQGEQ